MKILIIQTAFLGDVILATSVVEKLHQKFPGSKIDFLLRKGNDSLLKNHPFINEIIILNKKENKIKNLLSVAFKVRRKKYDCIVNLHRFGSSGFIVFLSGAKQKIGFDKNPFSFFFTKKFKHEIGNGKHEIERNHELIKELTDKKPALPKLYPSQNDYEKIKEILTADYLVPIVTDKACLVPIVTDKACLVPIVADKACLVSTYICIAPASVWFTKQYPKEKWIELINSLEENISVLLIGAKNDFNLCEEIKNKASCKNDITIENFAGKLSLLETAALMKNARMNYVNDSAPLHIASAMNAPVTTVFCSTVPAFGFGPLSKNSKILETKEKLDCRPCGLHGYKECPRGHFKCAYSINFRDLKNDL